MGPQKREKHEALHLGPFTGPKQIQLAVPVGDINAFGVIRPTRGGIDDSVHALEGVIQAVGLQQITPGELTSPFLKKRGLAGGSHHATDLVAFIKGTAGDLSPQGARATHHQNLHGAHVNKAGSLDGPCRERGSVALKLEQQGTAGETDGNQHPKNGGCAEDLRCHGAVSLLGPI